MKTEKLLTLQEATEYIPGSPHLSTLHRWVKYGLKGVVLESCLVGGRRVTSIEAVSRFSEAITSKVDNLQMRVGNGKPISSALIEAELDKAGI